VNADVSAILEGADMRERLQRMDADPSPQSPQDFARFVREEIAKWAKVVKALGLRVD
jgi:tripartite-type tricarboxylate transporter receptor subunit TctC